MKTVTLTEIAGSLSDHAKKGLRETVVVTKCGKPVIAVMPLTAFDDEESITLSTSPKLMKIVEASRRSAREHGAMSLAEVRQKYRLPKKASRTRKR